MNAWKNSQERVYLKHNDADKFNIQIGGRMMYNVSRPQMEALGRLLVEAGIIETKTK